MATKKPIRQKTIENPSVDYLRAGKEKALARLHKVLKTLDANGNDDDVFNASKIKASPRSGKSATPESSPKDSYGPGYINNYDSLYAALGKNRQDNPNQDYATDEETEVNEISDKKKWDYLTKIGKVERQSKAAGDFYWSSSHHPKEVTAAKAKHEKHVATAKKHYVSGKIPMKNPKEETELDERAYDKHAVNKEIRKDKRIGGKEAKLIHRLLRGRTTNKNQDHTMGSIIRKEDTDVNELYKSTLSKYTKKAKEDVTKHLERDPRAFNNRLKGMATADKKLSLQKESINEKLGKDASTKEYIDDFIASDAPQFEGKSKKKRIQMAVAASYKNEETIDEGRKAMPLHGHENHYKSDDELRYIAKDAHAAAENFKGSGMRVPGSHIEAENKYRDQMHDALTVLHHRSKGGKRLERPKTNEETLHEISKKILSRYSDKAQDDVVVRRFLGGSKDKANRRKSYIEKADKRVTGEETINELSPEKLTAYSAKASASHTDAILSADKKKMAKRTIGMGKAKALIRSEEAKPKSLEEVSKDLLTRYAAKASASKTDAILSVNKRKIANRTIGLGKAKALTRSDEEIEEAATTHKGPKRRSPAAAALRLPMYRKKVIPSGKLYNRKHKSVNEATRLPKGITSPGEIRKYLAMIAKQNKEKVAQVARALKKAEKSKHKVKTAHHDYHDHDHHDDHVRRER